MQLYLTDKSYNDYERICELYGKPIKNNETGEIQYYVICKYRIYPSDEYMFDNKEIRKVAFIVDNSTFLMYDISNALNKKLIFSTNVEDSGFLNKEFDGMLIIDNFDD